MRIAIDGSRIAKKYLTGTEYMSLQIVLGLARIDHENEYILYSPSPIKHRLPNLPDNFKFKVIPFPRLWSQIRLSWEILKRPKIDVWFFPAHTIPIIAPKNSVVIVCDLGFKYFPELYTPFERFYHNFSFNFSAKHAREIIAISNYTKKDILKFQPDINSSKIKVIYLGYDSDLFRKLPPSEKETPPIEDKYFFYIGRIEKKKNIVGLIESFRLLSMEKGIDHKLVLAGKPGYGFEEIEAAIAKLPPEIAQKILMPGYVDGKEVPRWLRHAEAFVFPSNFEGFGMPLIEAMACGTPVLAADNTAITEVVGKAGILVNNQKTIELAAAMSKMIHNKRERFSLISLGRDRAEEFSWDKCATETLGVIKKAAGK